MTIIPSFTIVDVVLSTLSFHPTWQGVLTKERIFCRHQQFLMERKLRVLGKKNIGYEGREVPEVGVTRIITQYGKILWRLVH
jgi:hypothetical protein